MALFQVNRYFGEEEEGSVSKETSAQVLLADLRQKAKEKQKRRSVEQREHRHEEAAEQVHPKKKRKADGEPQHPKKRHSETVAVCAAEENREKKGANVIQEEEIQSGSSPIPAIPAAPLTGFTLMGGFESKPVNKVDRVLPQWLAEPDVIHRDIKNNLISIADVPGLSAQLLKNLHNNGTHHFFPVQAEVIPVILESAQQGLLIGRAGYKPRDICVSAPTGSGKTLSFVVPIIQVLMERVVCQVRALAVLPTKELAQQVHKVFTSYSEGTNLKVVMLAGQKSFAAEQASLSEHRGGVRRSLADIVVATPGRLIDHITKDSGLCLQHLRFLIIDEADRMIDSMHQSWLTQVVKAVHGSGGEAESVSVFRRTEPAYMTAASLSPPQMPLQKLLFSATLTQNPEKLEKLGLHQPRLFSSIHRPSNNTAASPADSRGCFNFPQGLTEYYVPSTLSNKPLLILHFILRMKLSPILCFTNSRETAHRLYLLVQLFGGIQAAEFSSRLSPGERKKTLKEFEQGKIQLLISTDAAARGIDVSGVKCVVNYDAPQYIRTYIHRVGRTARAGKAGLAFTFLLGVQEKNFLQMVVEAGSPGIQKHMVKPENLKSMEDRYEQTLQKLADVIKDEKAS
ncbi:ATP-dependent RNA helicase DDX51 isoform X2 [Archocentrus centrarchus]|uniref:ATP-dependent RNA helicase DDX51 isoform X2 n=1 Tax=Archocentrus centrarchus TaxID=63155 RepID=UPI0011E9D955|nr:ATP-dependent RNA helicase DDX51 isoform X2 [Archocentrus centrarchus]